MLLRIFMSCASAGDSASVHEVKMRNIMSVNVGDFKQEIECVYKEERYSVRDNGAVLRHCREGKRPRPTDNQWTFGKPNDKNYLTIATEMIHRIVATAFLGEPPTEQHIVDHKDTNRHNNRPENLRWFTKLENVLRNPVTRKKIEFICGCSAEEFLANPAKYREKFQNSNYAWMRNVSEQEAETCLKNFQTWVEGDNRPSSGSLGEWVFNRTTLQNLPEISDLIKSKTLNAVQIAWQTPSEFPCCPQEISENPLETYAKNLKIDSVFCRNDLYSSFVYKSAMSEDRQSLFVMTKSEDEAVKSWALAKITIEEGLFIHTSIRSFFSKDGAEKQFTLAQGLEWTGGDSIDDYC